jgi:hypothetical protein
MSYNSKKEFKMTRDADKRKHSHDENEVCLTCKVDIDDCKCNNVVHSEEKTDCVSCKHCKYDYTQEKGMLFDEEGPNRMYIRAFKKWQQQPCEHCDKKYTKYLYEITYWAEEDWYENELMMQKYDRYLDRHSW